MELFLEKDDLNIDDIDKHLAIIVVRGKKQVIDILKKDVKTLIQVSTIDDAKKLDYFLTQLLKKLVMFWEDRLESSIFLQKNMQTN